ncbi:hypothetical protein DIPPA_11083 [Diplonema papillatum]|nr:hypothetical protein DIPPA_11083 [Diplonema papillatum]
MGGSASKDAESAPAPVAAKQVWTGELLSGDDAPDPRLLNEIAPDDPYSNIDFQSVPLRVLESLRKKVEKQSLEACRPHHEEVISCLRFMTTRPQLCKPLLSEYYTCMREWRADNDEEYYKLVQQAIDGTLLEKHRRRQRMLEEEWKKRFPDTPMPRANVPTREPGDSSLYVHELDKDLIARDLAMQRLTEIDAADQGLTAEQLKYLKPTAGPSSERSSWTSTW